MLLSRGRLVLTWAHLDTCRTVLYATLPKVRTQENCCRYLPTHIRVLSEAFIVSQGQTRCNGRHILRLPGAYLQLCSSLSGHSHSS
ncbi:hypothetical protein DE146DRAFT_652830 [Phaeosphaeria sp. MPI-PUGE-AT-0046c]|nr:hypothetical protein DE146DRAFT_652830 [Phaeosphaeria sp. MPI-PUGE-AT-0046c]